MYHGKYEKKDAVEHKTPAAANHTVPVAPSAPAAAEAPRATAPIKQKKKTRGSKKGTIIFYSIYAVCIIAFFIALSSVMGPLKDWLIQYENSQPNYKRDEVFAQLFADPDWEEIYELAGIEDTAFENGKSFAAAMDKLVGDTKLTCLETSAGLSGDKKYIVKFGEDKIASFTLTGGVESQTEIAEWHLGQVEVFFQRTKSVTVERFPGQTVLINGVALDDSYIIRTTATIAEDYLPEGIHGFRTEHLQINDLLVEPDVTVMNADGTAATVTLDAESGIYRQSHPGEAVPSEEEKALALNATKTYAEYMIGKVKLSAVQKLFDTNSQFYETIRRSEVGWVQTGASYAFTTPKYTDYYRYSDTLFSVKLEMTLQQTRFDGSVKNYNLNNTLFFQKNAQDKWLVMEATNVDVQQLTSQVRITFMDGEQQISTQMIDADTGSLALPAVTAPEGKVFSGWVQRAVSSTGKVTLTVVFEPTEDHVVYLPSDTALEPMTLYALYEEAKAE